MMGTVVISPGWKDLCYADSSEEDRFGMAYITKEPKCHKTGRKEGSIWFRVLVKERIWKWPVERESGQKSRPSHKARCGASEETE